MMTLLIIHYRISVILLFSIVLRLGFRLTAPVDEVLHKNNISMVEGSDIRVKCEIARPGDLSNQQSIGLS